MQMCTHIYNSIAMQFPFNEFTVLHSPTSTTLAPSLQSARSCFPIGMCVFVCVCMFTLRIRGWFSINVTGNSLTACSVQLYAAAKRNELKILRRLASFIVGFAYLQAFGWNDNLRADMYAQWICKE